RFALGSDGLLTAFRHKRLDCIEAIQFLKPRLCVKGDGLEKYSIPHFSDAHVVSRETKLLGQTYCLAASIGEKLRDFFHSISIYQWYIPRQSPFPYVGIP